MVLEMADLNAILGIIKDVLLQSYGRFLEILKTPFHTPDILWIITPLVISTIFIALYFGRYKKEELGWNTAFGNSIVLLFATVDLLRLLYGRGILLQFNVQNAIVGILLTEAIFMMIMNFYHILPKKFAFGLSSGITINVTLLISMLVIYSGVPMDYITAISASLMAFIIVGTLTIMQDAEPEADDDGEEEIN